jgi:hypothetical protein
MLTHSCNNLGLHSKLITETSCKVCDTTFAITGDIWYVSNVVEHVSAREHQDGDQTDRCPQIPVLDNGKQIWSRKTNKADRTQHDCRNGSRSDVVEGTTDRWLACVFGQLTNDPLVYKFGGQGTLREV